MLLEVIGAPVLALRAELARFEERVVRQRDALIALTGRQVADAALPETLRVILETSAATLEVARASIWRYDEPRLNLNCVDLYEPDGAGHTSGSILTSRDYPSYFAALATDDIVAADDAGSDPRTREFADAYLGPLHITSMADAPLHINGAIDGVLCFEHVGSARTWTSDEKAFVVSVSNLVSLAFERFGRHRAESTLSLQSAALNAAADAMSITDPDGLLLWVNPAFTRLTGYTAAEALGQSPTELLKTGRYDQSFYDEIGMTLRSGQVWRGELTNRRKDGTTYVEDLTITPVTDGAGLVTHFVALSRDLTERRQLEAQFLQAQKMEVVGRLAGGIAHDFNNLLTVINGTAELALMDLPLGHPVRRDFDRIRESGLRAAALTRQLLTFSRKQIVTRDCVDLRSLLTNFRGMLQRLIGEDITLIVASAPEPATVMIDPSQVEQVLLNLAVNSRDAMPRGGTLTIETSNVELDARFAAMHAGLKPGPHVLLAVADTGTGMSEDTVARMFEPFFTTKETGKGTGLGLATVYAIVEQSHGTVWATSVLGEGTTFHIYLPAVAALEAGVTVAEAPPAQGNETILLVEDESGVRDLATRILQAAGYTVLTAFDVPSALDRLATGGADVELIVTDVVLPGAGGRELADRAQHLRPGIPVLYSSGYTDDTVLAHGVAQNLVHYIGKPYTVSGLTNKVQEVLHQSRSGGGRS